MHWVCLCVLCTQHTAHGTHAHNYVITESPRQPNTHTPFKSHFRRTGRDVQQQQRQQTWKSVVNSRRVQNRFTNKLANKNFSPRPHASVDNMSTIPVPVPHVPFPNGSFPPCALHSAHLFFFFQPEQFERARHSYGIGQYGKNESAPPPSVMGKASEEKKHRFKHFYTFKMLRMDIVLAQANNNVERKRIKKKLCETKYMAVARVPHTKSSPNGREVNATRWTEKVRVLCSCRETLTLCPVHCVYAGNLYYASNYFI